MAVVDVQSKAQWVSLLKDGSPAVAFFWADWHEPSKPKGQMDAVFTHLASLHPTLRFLRVEAEAVPEVSVLFNVAVVPTFICLRGGPEAVADKLEGAHPAELSKKIQALSASSAGAAAAPVSATKPEASAAQQGEAANGGGAAAAPKGNLEERLKRLITAAPVVLFMKGSPSQPRCGFSNKMVDLLKTEGIGFASFDVFSDEEVRQGLKAYSNWPTYPQLYVHGELVGGLDIVQEMKAEGGAALKEQLGLQDLPANQPPQELTSAGVGVPAGAGGLEALIKRAPVMLFMKGSADAPKCGFSNKMVDLLRETGVGFDTFDILTDEEVRQGLKTYSNWPTYPQLYVDGELVGGLDIVREMKENGELDAVLKGSS